MHGSVLHLAIAKCFFAVRHGMEYSKDFAKRYLLHAFLAVCFGSRKININKSKIGRVYWVKLSVKVLGKYLTYCKLSFDHCIHPVHRGFKACFKIINTLLQWVNTTYGTCVAVKLGLRYEGSLSVTLLKKKPGDFNASWKPAEKTFKVRLRLSARLPPQKCTGEYIHKKIPKSNKKLFNRSCFSENCQNVASH